jgi:hypothetical protein
MVSNVLGFLPSAMASALHAAIVFFGIFRLRRAAATTFFLFWTGVNSLWCAANAGLWVGGGRVFDLLTGISLPFAPASMFLFSVAYGRSDFPRKYLLVYLIPALVWIPSAIVGDAGVSAAEFGKFQMPTMLILDVAAGFGWYFAWRRTWDRSTRNGAFVLLATNLPAVLLAGASYYVAFFIAVTPAYVAWFGDFVVGLASMLSLVVMLAVYPRTQSLAVDAAGSA